VQPNDDRQSQPGVAVRRTQLAVRLDPLGRQYGMGFETVCQRLSTLQGRKSLKATGDHGISLTEEPVVAEFDYCVVGAGFAGLTAALRLKQAGRSVALLEARDRVGGRTFTVTRDDGLWVDPPRDRGDSAGDRKHDQLRAIAAGGPLTTASTDARRRGHQDLHLLRRAVLARRWAVRPVGPAR
jgi:hypothetical protein